MSRCLPALASNIHTINSQVPQFQRRSTMSASTHNSPSATNHPARPYHKAPLVSKSAPWLSQGPPWSPRQGRPWSLGKVSLGPLGGVFFLVPRKSPLGHQSCVLWPAIGKKTCCRARARQTTALQARSQRAALGYGRISASPLAGPAPCPRVCQSLLGCFDPLESPTSQDPG